MFIILGHLAGALGLFFMGARLLTDHLKMLTNRRLRLSAAKWTRNRYLGFAWGLLAGSLMQSTTIVTFVVVSLLKSDLVSPKRGFPILLGGNVGGALLVLVVMLDVKLAALYVLGMAQIVPLVMARDRAARYQAMTTACFGLGMIVLGLLMLKEAVVPLAAQPWFQQTLQWMGDSLVLPLLSGAVLTLVVQSSGLAVVSGIGMAAAGLLTVEQVIMLYLGACLGSSLSLYLLTLNLTGRARQVAMYQVLYNVALNALFVPLLCLEGYLQIPLMAAAVRSSGLPLDQALAIFVIFSETFTAVFQLAILNLVVPWIERWWPPTEAEALAKPKFIHDHALDNTETALRLVDLEQRRLLGLLSRYLDTVRHGAELSELREAAKDLQERIEEFLNDLAARCPDQAVDEHNAMMTYQKLITWLEEQVIELCEILHDLPTRSSLSTWSLSLVEGIDLVLLMLIDALESNDAAAWTMATQLMGDRGELLRKLRDASLQDEEGLLPDERTQLIRLASITEHVFLLISQLAQEYRQASQVDEGFLEHALENVGALPASDVSEAASHPPATSSAPALASTGG